MAIFATIKGVPTSRSTCNSFFIDFVILTYHLCVCFIFFHFVLPGNWRTILLVWMLYFTFSSTHVSIRLKCRTIFSSMVVHFCLRYFQNILFILSDVLWEFVYVFIYWLIFVLCLAIYCLQNHSVFIPRMRTLNIHNLASTLWQ